MNGETEGLFAICNATDLGIDVFGAREWGVVGIKNMVEDHEENRLAVENLRAQAGAKSSVLEEAGKEVLVDEYGKVSVKSIKNEANLVVECE